MKSENKTIQAISAQAHGEAADNRLLRKKLREKDDLISDLRTQIDCLNRNLSEKVSQIADMMDKLVAFMMGRGDVTLSDSLRDAVISGVRAEYEMREKKLKEEYARQLDKMSAEFSARLAAKQNEINALKGEDGGTDGNAPSTTLPDGAKAVGPEEMAARNRQLEQQKANLQGIAFGQSIESDKYRHPQQQVENADDLDLDGRDVPEEKVVEIARSIKARKVMKGVKKPRLEQPLIDAARGGKFDIVIRPDNIPEDAVEIGEDMSARFSFIKGHIRTYLIRRKKYKDAAGNYYHANLPEKYRNCMGRTQATETLIAQILTMHFHHGMTLSDIEGWLKGMGLNFAHSTVMSWIETGANILEPLDDPLHKEITTSGNSHGDESTLKCKDKRLAGEGESEEDVEDDLHYFKRWIFCYCAPQLGLTQFVFHNRGRRTQEAVRKYFEDVVEKLYLHTDGAPIYKCYDVGELIVRIACLVHMRRPFFRLKDVSADAMKILKIFEEIFRRDKQIKADLTDPDEITRQRVLQIAPLFHDLKSYLDKLESTLKAEDEPELLKAVKYALKEYPCMLRCLEDGSLDLSNNICERQIRRIAKYRNNSFFVGSPEAGVRFARLMSVFANIRNHKLDPVEYLCDVFRRIKTTSKEKLVGLLAHRWQPASESVWTSVSSIY